MHVIYKKDVMKELDETIAANPEIHQIMLDAYESKEFLSNASELHKEGTLKIKAGTMTNDYYYRKVQILTTCTSSILLG